MRAAATLLTALLALAGTFHSPEIRADEPTPAPPSANSVGNATLQALAQAFFEWRRIQQPVQGDDIPRVERPDGWVPDYTPKALQADLEQYAVFLQSLDDLDSTDWSVADQIDARLLKAAMQRAYWELEVLKSPRSNPLFYVQQTLGGVFELLVLSSPMTESRAENIILRLEHFSETIRSAKKNLDLPIRPFAEATIASLDGIDGTLRRMESGLDGVFPDALKSRLHKAVNHAIPALEKYSKWLEKRLDTMQVAFAVGPNAYQWFLVNVALLPYTPGELLARGRQEWERAVALELLEQNQNRDVPPLPVFANSAQQIQASLLRENEIRAFLESQDLLTVPDWLMHYRNRVIPDYLEPLAFLGVTDDLTSESRLDEDAYSYIPEPSPELPYFALSAAKDPRPLIIHEGIPGHYLQLALSWANPDPIRRRYIDSSINEGIGFYVEEMLLQAGIFDFSPRSREIIYSFARLRALRVEVDIRLAIGDFTIDEAADYLARAVPMDRETAHEEAVFFASQPGQAISYQVGKLQIQGFLADARMARGDEFSLRDFHDFLMQNGNVPVALQRWEYLGDDAAVRRLDALGAEPVSVPR